jgi:hypothetical protein
MLLALHYFECLAIWIGPFLKNLKTKSDSPQRTLKKNSGLT